MHLNEFIGPDFLDLETHDDDYVCPPPPPHPHPHRSVNNPLASTVCCNWRGFEHMTVARPGAMQARAEEEEEEEEDTHGPPGSR